MAKQGEIDYLARLGPAGSDHARGKPFTDADCGLLLADLGGILMVLPPPPARVLDLGCGSGWTSVMLARRGYEVVGQDIAPDMIALAEANRAEARLANLRFVVCDYESLTFREEFDAALFYDSLHHAMDPAASLASVHRALRPGGIVVTLEPGEGHAHGEAARSAMQRYDVMERDMPPSVVIELGRKAGFARAQVHPMPKTVATLHYHSRVPGWWPPFAAPLYRWLALGWVTLAGRGRYGGMVVLGK